MNKKYVLVITVSLNFVTHITIQLFVHVVQLCKCCNNCTNIVHFNLLFAFQHTLMIQIVTLNYNMNNKKRNIAVLNVNEN